MDRSATFLCVLAGLLGAAGVAAAAAAAHGAAGADRLMLAAAMALVHAPALLALAALSLAGGLRTALPGLGLAVGTLLFSGDIGVRALTGEGLFPMAAPAGGIALIAGWLMVSGVALAGMRRRAIRGEVEERPTADRAR